MTTAITIRVPPHISKVVYTKYIENKDIETGQIFSDKEQTVYIWDNQEIRIKEEN